MHLKEDAQGKVIQSVLRGTNGALHARLSDAYDDTESVTKFAMLRWDTGTLSWVKYTGGGGASSDVNVLNWPAPVTDEISEINAKLLQQTEDIVRVDEASSTITYVGFAPVGTNVASSGWKLFRLDSSSGLAKLYADGDTNYDNTWTGRAGKTYS